MKKFDAELEGRTRLSRILGVLIALTAGAYFLSTYNYLLFHSVAELFSIVVAFGIFVVAWNSRTFHENDYLIFIGIAYLFVGSIDLIHTLAYEGMGVFPNYGADLSTQLWIIARYMESLSLLLAPVFFYRKLNYKLALIGYSSSSLILLLTVFYWNVFPRCFIPGSGLTPFKVTSEYVISAVLVGAILLLIYNRDEFDKKIFYFLVAALFLTIFSELLFTFYVSVYGISNLLGHLFKIGSFYLIYIALIDTGFKQPYRLLFKRLKDSERKYHQYFEELGDALFITKVGGDDHGKILDVNDRAAEQTCYDKEELIGMNIEEDLAVEPPTMGYKEGDERLSHGETINFTEKKVREDGTEYWTEVVVTPIEHEGETASLSINRDITERKKAKEKLKESEKQLRKSEERYKQLAEELEVILDHIPGLVFYKDTYNNFIKVNKRLADAHDLSKEELEGKSLFDLYPKEEAEKYWEDDKKVINSKEPILHRVEPWTPEKKRWMSTSKIPYIVDGEVKGVIGVSIDITERKEAEKALQEERDKLRNLHDAVDLLQQQENEEDLARTAVETSEEMLEFDLCIIAFLEEGNKLVPKANSAGLGPSDTKTFEIGEGVAGRAVQRGETIRVDDVRDHADAKPTRDAWRAFISAPIGEVGVLQVISEEEGSFDQRDVRLAEILADHLNEEVQRIRLEEELREQAIKDPLTGLYNRRYFNESLEKEVEKCKRYDKSLAFLMMDVNRFKEINDRYSHQTGDEVLQEVADLLEDNVRDADTVVRYGGDEFLIMMPETREVKSTVNRIEGELKRWNEESELLDFPLTLAMGAARWNPDQERGVEEALKEADEKMYEDKESSNFDGHA